MRTAGRYSVCFPVLAARKGIPIAAATMGYTDDPQVAAATADQYGFEHSPAIVLDTHDANREVYRAAKWTVRDTAR